VRLSGFSRLSAIFMAACAWNFDRNRMHRFYPALGGLMDVMQTDRAFNRL
jgi:hypothetical protein